MGTTYDVIVAGAGPAGGSAAYFLGEAGKRVLVLEKEHLPRYKACGGGLSPLFLEKTFPFSFAPILRNPVRQIHYRFGPFSITQTIPEGSLGMVMRSEFDAYLLSQARAEVRTGTPVSSVAELPDRVRVQTRIGEVFEAEYLIGADGANSTVRRLAGLQPNGDRRRPVAAIEVEARVPPQVHRRYASGPAFIFGPAGPGYLWIFPKEEHLSVGIAVDGRGSRSKAAGLRQVLAKEMARLGIPLEGEIHGHPIPIYRGPGQIASPRILLAGDAAGLVDPISGEGIRPAIKSGRYASQAILAGRPQDYPQIVRREIENDHRLARPVSWLFYLLQPLCLALGATNPYTTQAILDALADRGSSAGIMVRSLATLPLHMGTEISALVMEGLGGARLARRLREALYPKGIAEVV